LRILANRSLKDVVLIDNAAYSFGYQIENGIPIISWHDDPDDKELLYLMQYLKTLLTVDDVREVNQTTFHLSTFYDDYSEEFLGKAKLK
jgi:CTD small phosphatase-like protein 2